MTRAAAVMVVMVVGLRVTCRRTLKCLISALALSAGARMEVISSPVPPGVGIWAGVLDRDLDADAGPDVALVRQCGQPQRRRPVQRRQGVGARGGDVMGRAGLHRSGPHRKTSVIGQDLHVAAKGPVLTGVPQVVAGLGASGDPVSADQGPV